VSSVPGTDIPRILIVEDEAIIALMLQDMLEDSGFAVVGPATTVDEALTLSEAGNFDVAIIDVRLNGAFVYPVAERIRAAGRPFIFATGSGPEDLPPHFRATPVLRKPYAAAAVTEAVRAALALTPETT